MYCANYTPVALCLLALVACDAAGESRNGTGRAPAVAPEAVSVPVVNAPQRPETPAASPPPPQPIRVIEGSFLGIPEGLREEVSGRVRFSVVDSGVQVSIAVQGLPAGRKAAHVHEKGDCGDLRQKSAGGHFDPEGDIHGLPDSARHHRGDLGDVEVNDEGAGTLECVVRRVSLGRDDPRSLLERAVVIRSVREDGLGLTVGRPLACAVVSEHIAGSVLDEAQLAEEAASRTEETAAEADPAAGGTAPSPGGAGVGTEVSPASPR